MISCLSGSGTWRHTQENGTSKHLIYCSFSISCDDYCLIDSDHHHAAYNFLLEEGDVINVSLIKCS